MNFTISKAGGLLQVMSTVPSALPVHRQPRLNIAAENFRCIGSACEDSCCIGWSVDIDRSTYDKYLNLADSPLRERFASRIFPNPTSRNDDDFARVQCDSDRRCPFLDTDQLCSIQGEHGAEALSVTCRSYPRRSRRIDGRPERSLYLSCPEAARLVLLDQDFLRPAGADGSSIPGYRTFARIASALDPPGANPLQYFWEVRQLTLLLLQDRSYPLWQRLFILGLLCRRLESPQRTQPELLRGYAELMAREQLRGAAEQIPLRLEAQLDLLLNVLDAAGKIDRLPQRFQECVAQSFEALQDASGQPGRRLAAYAAASATHYSRFISQYEYMLENFVISNLIRVRFPYGDETLANSHQGPLIEFTLLALSFAIVKGILIGMAAYHRERLSPEHVVQLIQSFAKGFDHSMTLHTELVRYIGAARLHHQDAIAMMLRN